MDPRIERAVHQGPTVLTVHAVREGYPLEVATSGAAALFGFTEEELIGEPGLWASRIHPDDEGRVMRGLADIERSRAGTITFRFSRADGAIRWLRGSVRVTAVEADAATELAFSFLDVTEQTEYEQALRQQMDALRRSNLELEQFAHIASHDLSEPLRMVASYTRLVADRYAGQLDDDAQDFIGFAVSGAERMQAMIRDLLTYSRLGQTEPELKPLQLSTVLDTVEAMLRGTIEESTATVVRQGDLPMVSAAEAQILTVLQNLIANAIKFAHPDRLPCVTVSATPEDGRWRVSVADNGIGIEAAQHHRVFEAFKKLHRPEQYPGTGLGLSLCRRIVEHHGGEISLDSEPDVGTTVWFTLPDVDMPEGLTTAPEDGPSAEAGGPAQLESVGSRA